MPRERTLKEKADNCYKLAGILERIPKTNHRQESWVSHYEHGAYDRVVDQPDKNWLQRLFSGPPECGTTCCAMGWATLSNEFEGLVNGPGPVLDGEPMSFTGAGKYLFGMQVVEYVFMDMESGRDEIIRKLIAEGDELCRLAKEEAAENEIRRQARIEAYKVHQEGTQP